MSQNDFIIKIVLEAQSKLASVMAAGAAEVKKFQGTADSADKTVQNLDKHMDQLDGHVVRARDTLRSLNPTLTAIDNKMKTFSGNVTFMNRELGKVGTNAEKAAGGLALLDQVISKIDEKLAKLDAKMTEMGARTYEPKMEVKTAAAEAQVASLVQRLASATRGIYTAKTDVEIGAAMAKAEALRKELESLGFGERAIQLIIQINDEQVDIADEKMRRLEEDKQKLHRGTTVLNVDQREIDQLLAKLAGLTRGRYTAKTGVETAIADREIDRVEERLKTLGAGKTARALVLEIQTHLDDTNTNIALKKLQGDADAIAARPLTLRAILTGTADHDLDAIRRQMLDVAGLHVDPDVSLNDARARLALTELEARLVRLGATRESVHVTVDVDKSKLDQVQAYFGNLSQKFADKASGDFGGLSTKLRNAALLMAGVFIEPLLSSITGVVGGLVALAGAAGEAVVGLGGLATAALAQAGPAIGVLGLGIARLVSVFKASGLAQQEKDKAGQQSIAIDKGQANAADALAAAQRGVVDAQKRLVDAQNALTAARQQGIRTLTDLDMVQRRANLSADESRLSLANQVAGGGGGLFEDAYLQSRTDNIAARRQNQDTRKAQAGGIEGLPAVVQATKAVSDAARGVEDARRAVEKASEGMDSAASSTTAAASAYAIALAKLSPAERELLNSVNNFKKQFTDTAGPIRETTDIITRAFAHALDDVTKLVQDPKVIDAFQGLATSVGFVVKEIADFFTTGPMRQALIFFTDEAATNVPILASIFESLITVFVNVAHAASGPLRDALISINGYFEDLAKTTGDEEHQKSMESFFMRSIVAMGDFLKLGGAIIGLFAALAGAGGAADEGKTAIESLTGTIRDATRWVKENGDQVQKFFHDSIAVSGEVLQVLFAIGKTLVQVFDPASVKQFSEFLQVVVLPLLKGLVQTIGFFTRALLEIANSPVGKFLVTMTAYALGAAFAFGRLVAVAGLVFRGLELIAAGLGGVVGLFGLLPRLIAAAGFAGLAAQVSGIGAAFVAMLVPIGRLLQALPIVGKLFRGLGVAGATGAAAATGTAAVGATEVAGGAAVAYGASRAVPVLNTAGRVVGSTAPVAAGEALTGTAAVAGVARFAGLLKTSVIASLAIATAQGLYTGFKDHSVADGLRDFFSSLTFGIIDSAKKAKANNDIAEAAEKKAQSDALSDAITNAIKNGTPKNALNADNSGQVYKVPGSKENSTTGATVILGKGMGGPASNAPIYTNGETNAIKAFANQAATGSLNKSSGVSKEFEDLYKSLSHLQNLNLGSSLKTDQFDDFQDALNTFRKNSPKTFQAALDAMQDAVNASRKKFDDQERLFNQRGRAVNKFGVDIQLDDPNDALRLKAQNTSDPSKKASLLGQIDENAERAKVKQLTSSLLGDLAKLPPSMRQKGKDSALALADGLEKAGAISKDKAKDIRDSVNKRFDEMKDHSTTRSTQLRENTTAQIGAMANVIQIQMAQGVSVVNTFLDALGVKKIKAPSASSISNFLTKVNDVASSDPSLKAVGGWVGNPGERGEDAVDIRVGRGELVLNADQQKLVNSKMAGQATLNSTIKSARSYHAGGAEQSGYAKGGFVNNVGAHIDTPAEQTIASDLAKLGRALGIYFSPAGPRSARRTPGENNAVGGSPTSNHLKGKAMDVAPEAIKTISNDVLNRYGLNRPMPGNWNGTDGQVHDERNHIELLAGATANAVSKGISTISGSLTGAVSAAMTQFKKLTVPDVGTGTLAEFSEAIMKKAADAANTKMGEQAAAGSDSSDKPQGGGAAGSAQVKAWATEALKLTNHFNKANLNALIGRIMFESGGNPKAINLTDSNAAAGHPSKGLGQTIDSTFQSYRDKSLKNDIYDPIANLVASIRYMYARYGHIMGNTGVGYAAGGPVPGTGSRDTVPAMLMPGEHIWTKEEVRNAGGHEAMFAMRKQLGGGGQSKNSAAYAIGGIVLPGPNPVKLGRDNPDTTTRDTFKSLVGDSAKGLADRIKTFNSLLQEFTVGQLTKIDNDLKKEIAKVGAKSDVGKKLQALRDKMDAFIHDPLTILEASLSRVLPDTDFQKSVNAVIDATKKISTKSSKSLDKLAKSLDFLQSDSGPFDRLESRMATATQKASNALSKRINNVSKDGKVGPGLDATSQEAADQEIGNLNATRNGQTAERSSLTAAINKAQDGLKNAKTEKQRQSFRNSINSLTDRRNTVDTSIATTEQNIVQRTYQAQNDQNNKTTTDAGNYQNWMTQGRRILAVKGGTQEQTASLYDAQSASMSGELNQLQGQLNQAQSSGNSALASTITQQINELNTSVAELAAEKIKSAVSAITSAASSAMAKLDIQKRIRAVQGGGNNSDLFDQQIATTKQEIGDLTAQMNAAAADGNTDLQNQLADQIGDLNASVYELADQKIQAAVAEINRQADRKDAAIAISNRMADIQTAAGDAMGGLLTKGRNLAATGANLVSRRDGLQGQMQAALAAGDTQLAEQLSDQINDLNASIAENTQAQKDQTFAVRKLSTDIITNAGSRTTGLIGSAGGILVSLATMAGSDTVPAQQQTLAATGASLQTTQTGLLGQIGQSVAGNEFGGTGSGLLSQLAAGAAQGPGAFASILQTLAPVIAQFESTLGPEALASFQGLVDGLTSNEVAIVDNTAALKALNTSVAQTFSSTAWTTFRQAIFNGNGGLLPQYDIPQMETGGYITKGGLFELHAGEKVVPADMVNNGGDTNVNVNITNPSEVFDPAYAGKVIAWNINGSGRQ